MNPKVFFSYSHKDKQIAQKIYWDLINSGVSVWRDQINGEPCANFKEEFLRMVDQCEIFFVLDSSNYRSNSTWCLLEIERYFKKECDHKRMFIALLEVPGEWREIYRSDKEKFYFKKLNEQIYIELFANGIYDNDAQYSQGISMLVNYFGGTYLPWHKMPEEQDLLDELANINTDYKISDAERNSILSDFRTITQRYLQGAPTTDQRIALWIQDCEFLHLQLIIPYLYSGIRLVDQGKYEAAIKVFMKIIEYHKEDPRGYRGLGLCFGNVANYPAAMDAYNQAYNATQNIKGRHNDFMWEILINRAHVLMETGNYRAAADDYLEVISLSERSDFDILNPMLDLAFCYRQLNISIEKRISLLEKAREINAIEERVYIELGNCYLDCSNYNNALIQFIQAFNLVPSTRNAFAMCLCYANMHDVEAIDKTISHIDKSSLTTEEDIYYYGFMLYVLGDDIESRLYYDRCNRELWQWYGNL